MENRVNFTVVGAFVLILGISLIFIAIWLSAGISNKHYKTYLAYMNESVSGLSENASVKYNGVNVGYVKNIELNPHDPRQVKLLLDIDQNIIIHEGTSATLTSQGLTGVSYIDLKGGDIRAPKLRARHGEAYPVIHTEPSFLFRLDTVIRSLTVSVNQLANDMQTIVGPENRKALHNTLLNIEKISTTIASNSNKLNQSILDASTTLKNTAQASKQLPALVKNLHQTSKTVQSTMQNFSQQTLPQANDVLLNIQNLTNHLQNLATDIERNPNLLISGRQPNPAGPGE